MCRALLLLLPVRSLVDQYLELDFSFVDRIWGSDGTFVVSVFLLLALC